MNVMELNPESYVIFNNTKFIKNAAINNGGVIFSNSKIVNNHVFFNNCEFDPGYANNGNIFENYINL